ncbi:MFS transporter [Hoyosella altamirensis]|uniref:DHA2 family multidrug resistance protein-like MFS transporter n=1 Tax=Hoyosella altamirensis TaxID=616997 RepID=A0A839RKI5_9ACTN|nr:MFS transporter [Hoyosella altamirensis]MBB3037382.1 DHA2 family multidrug resistance protein-like MFS transporter [Hoyosella altamirensis]
MANPHTTSETGHSADRATTREWAGLALLLLPMLALATDLTVLFFALPTITADLSPSATQGLWIVHVYGFLIAGFLITMGRLGDRIGRRRLLLTGGAAFAVLSVVAAYSTSPEMLIAARALLGIAGATLMPSLFSLLRTMFPNDDQRRFAIAVIFSAFTAGGAIGPLLGGALLEFFWWGSVFLINVPPLLLLVVLGPRLLPEQREENPAPLDLLSVALSVVAMLAIVYGLQDLAAGYDVAASHPVWLNLLIAGAGAGLLGLFIRRQRSLHEPLFDLVLLTRRRTAIPLAALLLTGIGVVGVFYLFTQYLQWVAGLSPLYAGLWTLPYIVVNIAGAMLAPGLVARYRQAAVVTAGLSIAVLGLVFVAIAGSSPLGVVVAAIAVTGFGHGVAMALVSDLIISGAPAERAGSAAAAQEVSGELGTAAGIAAGGAIGVLAYRITLTGAIPPGTPESAAAAARSGIHEGVAAAEQLGARGHGLVDAVREAFTAGMQVYAGVGAAITAAATLLVAVTLAARGRG